MNNTHEMTFGEKLKDLRKSLKKSQTEMADEIATQFPARIRISQTTLSALEQRTDLPREDIVEVLADYFGVSPTYFATHENQNIENARSYLEFLRKGDFPDGEIHAHSKVLRKNRNDEVGKSIRNLRVSEEHYSDEDFFDT